MSEPESPTQSITRRPMGALRGPRADDGGGAMSHRIYGAPSVCIHGVSLDEHCWRCAANMLRCGWRA